MPALLLCKKGFKWIQGWIFFRPPTLTSHSFAASWAIMMKSGSFKSPKSYLLALNFKNSIVTLLTSVRTSSKVQIYYINRVLMILNCTPLYLYNYLNFYVYLFPYLWYVYGSHFVTLVAHDTGHESKHTDVCACKLRKYPQSR